MKSQYTRVCVGEVFVYQCRIGIFCTPPVLWARRAWIVKKLGTYPSVFISVACVPAYARKEKKKNVEKKNRWPPFFKF